MGKLIRFKVALVVAILAAHTLIPTSWIIDAQRIIVLDGNRMQLQRSVLFTVHADYQQRWIHTETGQTHCETTDWTRTKYAPDEQGVNLSKPWQAVCIPSQDGTYLIMTQRRWCPLLCLRESQWVSEPIIVRGGDLVPTG